MIMSNNDMPKEIEKIIDAKEEDDKEFQDFANTRDAILLAFIGSYIPKRYNPSTSASASMNIRDEFGVEKVLTELEEKLPDCKNKKVYFLVNSIGGNLSSAYKIARAIRDAFSDITVFVPHYALSGGTMLALTGNKIVMGRMSQLSPLDVQLFYSEGLNVSANSMLKALERMNEIFSTSSREELPYPYVHLAESLDPVMIEEWAGIQDECRTYLKEILKMSGYNNEVDDLADTLVFYVPYTWYCDTLRSCQGTWS
jgi:ClpP class serine protease